MKDLFRSSHLLKNHLSLCLQNNKISKSETHKDISSIICIFLHICIYSVI